MTEQIHWTRIADVVSLEELSYEERAILTILSQRRGRDLAIPVRALAEAVKISERDLRDRVKHLVEYHGVLIGSSIRIPYGYYMISDSDEVEEAVQQLQHRMMSLAVRISRLRKISLEEVFGQLTIYGIKGSTD
jgi:DNA-binding Lrp family transcriptional regulator